MDNHHNITARPRNKFWFAFFVLFFFWYLLIYGSDWSSLPGLSSVSRQQQQQQQQNPIESVDNRQNSLDSISVNPKSDDDVAKEKNASVVFDVNDNSIENVTVEEQKTTKNNEIEDLAAVEKELEPLLPKQDDEDEEEDSVVKKRRARKPCAGRYIYVHDLPTRFNDDYIKQCKLLNKWHDMCQYFANDGLGENLGNPQRLFQRSAWYVTHQFSLDVIFHDRMKQYECLTNDSSKAAAVYVPYYGGFDVARFLWDPYNTSVKDADSVELFRLLRSRPEWDAMGGKDHFIVSGRIAWDFHRAGGGDDEWGNKLLLMPESQNVTMVTIESSPWDKNDFAIPYPTYFHPSSDDQVYEWQNKMRRQKRRALFSACSLRAIRSLGRSTSIDSGCIPVFFHPGSAYIQYLWHLPKDFSSYSVLIPEGDVKNKKVSIDSVLSRIPSSKVSAMREKVIKLIPSVIYADPRARLEKLDDAFDLAIKGVVERVDSLRKEMKEGRNYSDEFDSEYSWKYYAFGTTEPHEWDNYFKRYR
ncbi:hypothetical protein DH2020_000050 [Rehmannia glutinosa]|uniref:Exostosin GT47 domain-containing protein n=1 Tax=Rehmannia glutinosa TaxID=99300 RepID=A0ABR0XVV4_REHGL